MHSAGWAPSRPRGHRSRIANAGKGNFLYARYVLDELAVHAEALADPATVELPDGLGDVYRRFIRRDLARSREMWGNRYRPLLGLLAVARSPGLTDTPGGDLGLLPSQTDDALAVCKQYLAGNLPQGLFSIYHQSFRYFLLQDPEYSVYPVEAEQVLGPLLRYLHGRLDPMRGPLHATQHTGPPGAGRPGAGSAPATSRATQA